MKMLVLVILGTLLTLVSSQANDQIKNPCVGQKTCGKCIGASPLCGWCSDEDYAKTNKDRCDRLDNLAAGGCSDSNISNPPNKLTNLVNQQVQDGVGEGLAIQIQPQSVHIKLRPNKPETFQLHFRLAENYPVDLYYLMDLSNSMADDKDNLAALGNKIAESMSEITQNFRLGFGSFVDKVVMPYVSTVPKKLLSPCEGCEAPYSFKNQLKLDKNTDKFEEYVRRAKVSGNLDAPEGGFDAIMQSVQCQDIGWRNVSRKLLLFSTDAGFHFAGDGKNQIGWRNQSRKMLLFSTDAGFHFAGDGKMPTFRDGDVVVNESGAICLYLESKYSGDNKLIPDSDADKAATYQRMFESDNMRSNIMDGCLYYKLRTKKEKWDMDLLKENFAKAETELGRWNDILSGKKYVCGEKFSMADVFFFPSFAFMVRNSTVLDKYPGLQAYYDLVKDRPSVKATWPPHWKNTPKPNTLEGLGA